MISDSFQILRNMILATVFLFITKQMEFFLAYNQKEICYNDQIPLNWEGIRSFTYYTQIVWVYILHTQINGFLFHAKLNGIWCYWKLGKVSKSNLFRKENVHKWIFDYILLCLISWCQFYIQAWRNERAKRDNFLLRFMLGAIWNEDNLFDS